MTKQKGAFNKMYIIAGLGNPKREYDNTRHNIGFAFIDRLAEENHITVMDCKHKALIGKGVINGQKVILAKPLTYMNLSGESIRALVDYYKVDASSELIVVSDDISLPPSQIRIRKQGSDGGHNGLKNIIQHLGGGAFQRIRIGVGEKPKGYDLCDYVLGHFSTEEKEPMEEGLQKAIRATGDILEGNIDKAMNEFNRKVTKGIL